jgi:hypothetical protein
VKNEKGFIQSTNERTNANEQRRFLTPAHPIITNDQGESICHLEVGQPVQAAPPQVLEAAKNALVEDRLGYTSALGISELRKCIAESYGKYPDVGGKDTGERRRRRRMGRRRRLVLCSVVCRTNLVPTLTN